jgi:hypothetical protein
MKIDANLPPEPNNIPETPRLSQTLYVWRGDKFDQIGLAMTQGQNHLARFDLGVQQNEVIEIRATAPEFYPGRQKSRGETKPSHLAFFAGTGERAGTAFPHEDGKGHRLKLRIAIPDGAEIELRDSGHYRKAGDQQPTRSRQPTRRPTNRLK